MQGNLHAGFGGGPRGKGARHGRETSPCGLPISWRSTSADFERTLMAAERTWRKSTYSNADGGGSCVPTDCARAGLSSTMVSSA